MTDLFEEVEDELRKEQLKRVALKAAPVAIAVLVAVLVIGGGIVGYSAWQNNRAEKASVAYDAALTAVSQGDLEGSFNAFGEIARTGPAIYKYMALSHQAGIRVQQQKPEEAVALFDQAADAAPKSEAGLLVADFARLKAAWLVLDTASFEDVEKRLKPLAAEDRPYSPNARYALATAMLKAGKKDEARAEFLAVSALVGAPESLTQSAEAAVELIDTGAGEVLNQIVEHRNALPAPQFELTPEMLQQLMQQQGAQGGPAQ